MARPRSRERRGWPDHLNARRLAQGGYYYFYRDPVRNKDIGLGHDFVTAAEAVRIFQRNTAVDPVQAALTKLEESTNHTGITVGRFIAWYLTEHLPNRRHRSGEGLSEGTLKNWKTFLNRVSEKWGKRPLHAITTLDVTTFLRPVPPASANNYRGMFVKFFQSACSEGHRPENPAALTVAKDVIAKRGRLTQAQYDAIFAAAPAWLQRAMTLSLLSLQREGDLCTARSDAWDGEWWHFEQSKGRGHGDNRFRFRAHTELAAALNDCAANRVADCPFLLSRLPQRKAEAKGREHWAQITDTLLSMAFAEVRDSLEVCPADENKLPPSYYEIKALGAKRYEDAGRPKPFIQFLCGHRDAATTQIYLDRHKTKWNEVDLTVTGPQELVRKRVAG